MTRALAAYWLTGCVLAGIPLGQWAHACPGEDPRLSRAIEVAAAWPLVLVAAVAAHVAGGLTAGRDQGCGR